MCLIADRARRIKYDLVLLASQHRRIIQGLAPSSSEQTFAQVTWRFTQINMLKLDSFVL